MTEPKKEYCVLKPERSLASALKFVYLIAFIIACYNLIPLFHLDGDVLLEMKHIEDGDSYLFTLNILYFVIGLFVIAHHIRLYLTIELLEDPSSNLHQEIIVNLGPLGRFFEQLIRMIIACFVGLKAFDVIIQDNSSYQWLMLPARVFFDNICNQVLNLGLPENISVFSGKNDKFNISFFVYLSNIFILLFVWDFIILFFSRSLKMNFINNLKKTIRSKKKITELINSSKHVTLIMSHIIGISMCVAYIHIFHVYGLDVSDPEQQAQITIMPYIIFFVTLVFVTILYVVSIGYDFYVNFKVYKEVLKGMIINIFCPYYGDSCIGKCFETNSGMTSALSPLVKKTKEK